MNLHPGDRVEVTANGSPFRGEVGVVRYPYSFRHFGSGWGVELDGRPGLPIAFHGSELTVTERRKEP